MAAMGDILREKEIDEIYCQKSYRVIVLYIPSILGGGSQGAVESAWSGAFILFAGCVGFAIGYRAPQIPGVSCCMNSP